MAVRNENKKGGSTQSLLLIPSFSRRLTLIFENISKNYVSFLYDFIEL